MTYQADITEDGAYHFDVDVDSLSLGLHRIMFMLTNAKGHHTSSEQVFFTKVPAGGNGITRYDYWLNQDEDTYKTVSLEKDAAALDSGISERRHRTAGADTCQGL